MTARPDLPKYEQVKEVLRSRIQHGELQVGERLPSEHELMEALKVSRHTVRQAVGDLVAEGWLDRRHGSGTFVLRQSGGGRRNRLVGVVTTFISEYIFPSIVRGIERHLSEHGYGVILASTDNRRDREPDALALMLEREVSGLIVEPAQSALPGNLKVYREIAARSIPLVMINGNYPGLAVPTVTVDDYGGGYRVAEHLIDLGHADIAMILKGDDVQGIRRGEGAMAAMRSHGIVPRAEWTCWYTTVERETLPAEFLRRLLASPVRPTALLCYNDQVALHMLPVLEQAGLRVPEDISITGFDDSSLLATAGVPLTTVSHPKEELGRQAAELVVRLMEEGAPAYRQSVCYLTDVVARSSTGPAAGKGSVSADMSVPASGQARS